MRKKFLQNVLLKELVFKFIPDLYELLTPQHFILQN